MRSTEGYDPVEIKGGSHPDYDSIIEGLKISIVIGLFFSVVRRPTCLSQPTGPGHEEQVASGTHDLIG